ncbi:hypothetical protein J497_03383 [Acinetobacter baumannii 1121032]|nr:hypothetical protein J497_03383 [Acinetobacter baumannii 1121032]
MLAQKTFEASAILYNFGLKDSVKLNYLSLQAQFEDYITLISKRIIFNTKI